MTVHVAAEACLTQKPKLGSSGCVKTSALPPLIKQRDGSSIATCLVAVILIVASKYLGRQCPVLNTLPYDEAARISGIWLFKPDQHPTPHDAIRYAHHGLRIHRFDRARRRRRLDVADDTRNDPDDGPPVGTDIRRDRPRARRQTRPVPCPKRLVRPTHLTA